ncbi:MAG: hypothetical protein methR_P3588 [Methyloprofundus sp.]|nr:MAG: hypothetical protein methR_P3588 [Methyloprofundus sp.]
MNKNIKYIPLNNLSLDLENPRLPLAFRKNQRTQESIINWLLEDASIIELMLAIGQNDFFIGEALLAIESTESDKYIVVDGNRRLTALFLLNDISLADVHTRKIAKVLKETPFRPTEIPCIIFQERAEILQYLGYRHITGIKSWSLVAKARYLNSLLEVTQGTTLSESARELAKKIGSRSDYVKKILVSYEVYLIIEDEGFYKIPSLDESSLHFIYIADSLAKEHIRQFIAVDLSLENPLEHLNQQHLKELINWFFRKNENNKSQVLGNSDQLKQLNEVLSNPDALQNFREQGSLKQALKYAKRQ